MMTIPSASRSGLGAALPIALLASSLVACGDTGGPISAPSPSPETAAGATAAPSPLAMSQALQVPLTTPVILFHDPVNLDQIDGITWDGTSSGRVLATGGGSGFLANSAGSLYATFADHAIHDRTGHLVAPYDAGNQKTLGVWADDGRHYCQEVSASKLPPPGGEPAMLRLAAPGVAPKIIAWVGKQYSQASAWVAGCSMQSDLAVVVQGGAGAGSLQQFWVVQLSTGRILWSHLAGTQPIVNVEVSPTGQYIAETRSGSGQPIQTTVFANTGTLLGRVPGTLVAFSWDGSLAVVSSPDGSVDVIRWRDGTHVWGAAQGLTFSSAQPEPAGSHIAVALRNPDYQQTTGWLPIDLYVVGVDGQASELLHRTAL